VYNITLVKLSFLKKGFLVLIFPEIYKSCDLYRFISSYYNLNIYELLIFSFASRAEMIIRDTVFVDNKAGILENAVYNAKYE